MASKLALNLRTDLIQIGMVDASGRWAVFIELPTKGGKETLIHSARFERRFGAELLAANVRKARAVNLEHWHGGAGALGVRHHAA